jgi:uncharacterized Zn finger protein
VAERRAKALKKLNALRKKGKNVQPVKIEGRTIARSFWGKGWCDHLESFSDYANRLPRGRTYIRNGSVCHLEIEPGRIEAMVAGSSLYIVSIRIKELKAAAWKAVKQKCSGQIGSMLELLQGKISDQVMAVVSDRKGGLFPKPDEIELSCSCPDWAVMCKHVAAVLYGVGSRLDTNPELLFVLRDVDAEDLIAAEMTLPGDGAHLASETLADDQLSNIFDIDFDTASAPASRKATKKLRREGVRPSGKPTPRLDGPEKAIRSRTSANSSSSTPPNIRPTGKSVARLRKQLGLSVLEFAETLGVSPATVYRWESTRGRLNLQSRALNSLAELQRQVKAR